MKKFYTTLLWLILAIVMVPTASALTITLKVDNTEAAYFDDPSDGNQVGSWDDNGQAVLTVNSSATIPVLANDGYTITGVSNGTIHFVNTPTARFEIPAAALSDGDVVTITTAVEEAKYVKIVGDPAKIKVRDDQWTYHESSDNVDGAWTLKCTSQYGFVVVEALSGYFITSLKGKDGVELLSAPVSSTDIQEGPLEAGTTTFTVEAKTEDELYDGLATVVLTGSPYQVQFRFNGQYNGVELTEGENKIHYSTSSHLPFHIKHAYDSDYNHQSLYSVKINDEVLTPVDRAYTIESLEADDVIYIDVLPPANPTTVKIEFADEDSKGAVSGVYYNNNPVDPDDYASFDAETGKSLRISFNTTDYDVTVTENGEHIVINYGGYDKVLVDENGYTYVVTATAKQPYNLTVICDYPEALIISPNYSGDGAFEITSEECTIQVPPSNSYLFIKAKDGYKVVKVTDNTTGATLNVPLNITGDMSIYIEMEQYKRDQQVTVYRQPKVFNYLSFTICPSGDLRSEITLEDGYNTVNFNDGDVPFSLGGADADYAAPEVFLNDVKLESSYGSYVGLDAVKNGDVLKIMKVGAEQHDVTYNVDPNVNVRIVHDRTRTVDPSGTHTPHVGTEIYIIPVVSADPVVRRAAAKSTVKVSANGTQLEADEEGKFVHTVVGPVTLAIEPADDGDVTSITDIEAGADTLIDVYNLQGVKVRNAATAADINTLPAGVYITSAGKKIVKK